MNFNERPLIITDLETTGLDPAVHSIIEIASIKVHPKTLAFVDVFESKVFISSEARVRMSYDALAINGYNANDWLMAPSLLNVMEDFYAFSMDGVLVSQNVTFEHAFLREAFRKTGSRSGMDYHAIDLPSIVWFMYPDFTSLRLSNVAQQFGIPEEPKPHKALNGAEYVWKILGKMAGLDPATLKVY